MGKTFIEIRLMSARQLLLGAGFGCSLLKHQWFAVVWIDPKYKYCTTVDGSRSDNPLWGTQFHTSLDDSKIHALHVEVYSRVPIFLTKKLHGSVTIPLKQFLAKYKKQSSSISTFEETISCQLRKENSSKPRGFVNVSIRISAESQYYAGFPGPFEGGFVLPTNPGHNSSGQNDMAGSSQHPFATLNQPNSSNSFSVPPDNHHFPMPNHLTNNPFPPMQKPYYPPPPMQQPYYPPPPVQETYYPSAPPLPPPPPATSNAGYIPSSMPRSDNAVKIPSSSSGGSAGQGAGKIAAGDAAFNGRDVYLT